MVKNLGVFFTNFCYKRYGVGYFDQGKYQLPEPQIDWKTKPMSVQRIKTNNVKYSTIKYTQQKPRSTVNTSRKSR